MPLATALVESSATGSHPVRTVRVSQRERLLIWGSWILYALVTVANRLFGSRRGPDGVSDAVVLGIALAEAAAWALLTPSLFELVARRLVREEAGAGSQGVGDFLRFFVIGIVVAAAMAGFGTVLRTQFYPPRPSGDGPPVWFAFTNNAVLFGAVITAGLARAYSLQSRWREERAVRLEAELALATLATLRQQIDPHFLFNTLNLISSLVERDPRGVRRMIARLSELLRASLETGGTQEIPLRQELTLLNAYLEIMRMRFGDRLTIGQAVDEALLDVRVPSFLLQPLAENAMRHGIEPLRQPGRMDVLARREGNELVLQVRDNGQPATPLGAREGIGLGNTRSRLEQLYGAAARLELRRDAGQTVAEVRMPLLRQAS